MLLGNSVIKPDRIRQARIARGYSLVELSEQVGVSKQAISQYEKGVSKPSDEIVRRLVDSLSLPYNYFTEDLNGSSEGSTVFFRSKKTTRKKDKEALKIQFEWINTIKKYFGQYVTFPETDLPNLDSFFQDNHEMDFDTIEEIAMSLREYWGLSDKPIDNLASLLEEKGFILTSFKLGSSKIDGFSAWFDSKPYIVVGSDKGSSSRRRFDLAHELGHLILHSWVQSDDIVKKEISERIEKEADRFAGAFLLPAESFANDMVSISINHLFNLKPYWKVSAGAMIYRMSDLDIVTENQLRYLKMKMRPYWRKEINEDKIYFEEPSLFKIVIEIIKEHGIKTSEDILREIPFYKKDIDSMCNLPIDFLKPKMEVEKTKLRLV